MRNEFVTVVEDVQRVLFRMGLNDSYEHAKELYSKLDLKKVQDAAMTGQNDIQEVDYAYREIVRQIREIEHIKPAKPPKLNKKQKIIQKYVDVLKANDGGEMGHMEADNTLCEFLRELGYGEVAEAFEGVENKGYS